MRGAVSWNHGTTYENTDFYCNSSWNYQIAAKSYVLKRSKTSKLIRKIVFMRSGRKRVRGIMVLFPYLLSGSDFVNLKFKKKCFLKVTIKYR